MGPGLYEVCRVDTRERVAFGCTRDVAESLCDLSEAARPPQMAARSGAAAITNRRARIPDLADRDTVGRQAVASLIRERHEAMLRQYAAARV